jgi:hypothetical protein
MRGMISGMATLAFAGLLLSGLGCTPGEKKTSDTQAKGNGEPKGGGKKDFKASTKHDGWWCKEHGVPEEVCSLCSDEAATKFKKEGDWCNLHDRARSQCFKCDPSLYAKYEAMYTAKYGSAPPRPPEEEFKK